MIIAVEYSHRGFDVVGEREFDVVRGFFDSGMTHQMKVC